MPDLPAIARLHERHPGVTPNMCGAMAEAAAVCMARHYPAPPAPFGVERGVSGTRGVHPISWTPPDDRTCRTWGNRNEATEFGASGVTLAAVEAELSLFVIDRADTGTGADYYLGEDRDTDLERAVRLEVAGQDGGTRQMLEGRLRTKQQQVTDGDSDRPGFAAVVGFKLGLVLIGPTVEGTPRGQ